MYICAHMCVYTHTHTHTSSLSTIYLQIIYCVSGSVPDLGDGKTIKIWFLSSNRKHNYKTIYLFGLLDTHAFNITC